MRKHALYLALLIASALALSLYLFFGESLRLDEAQSLWQTSRGLDGMLHVIAKDVHMPLYFFILHFWEVLFGTGEAAVRSLSLVFFLASIPAVFYLAARAYSVRVAYFSAFLAAFSPFLVWYGSEARMYSLLFLVTAISHFVFIDLWRNPTRRARIWYAVISVVGLFTHVFFGLILLSQALFYFVRKDAFGKGLWLAYFRNVAILVSVFGASWYAYREIAGAGLSDPLLSPPTSVDFFNVFSNFFIGFQADAINTFILSLWPFLVFVAFTFISRRREAEAETSYLMISSFLPIALSLLLSVTYRPVFLSRYLIVSLPSLYVLAVYFLASYKERARDIALFALSATVVFMLALQALDPDVPVKEDYRGAALYVEAHADPGDLFVVSAPFLVYPVEYYYRGAPRLATFPRWERFTKDVLPEAYTPDLIAQDAAAWAKTYEDVYMLFGYDQGYEEDTRVYMDTHYQRIDMKTFSPGLTLYVYRLRYL